MAKRMSGGSRMLEKVDLTKKMSKEEYKSRKWQWRCVDDLSQRCVYN